MVSSKKKWTVMNPIRRQMKKRNPSSGQNGQLVHWWLLIHSGHGGWVTPAGENNEFQRNRASNGLTGNENFTNRNNWEPN
jgi:hypothetical protein